MIESLWNYGAQDKVERKPWNEIVEEDGRVEDDDADAGD